MKFKDQSCKNCGLKFYFIFINLVGILMLGGYIFKKGEDVSDDKHMARQSFHKMVPLLLNVPQVKELGLGVCNQTSC